MTAIDASVSATAGRRNVARAMSCEASLPTTIEIARVMLVVGLVFLHYFAYPNSRVSPFIGLDPDHHPVATFVNSVVLFFFFSAVPLLSTISGWLFFGFTEAPFRSIGRRIGSRTRSLLAPLVAWNLATLLIGIVLRVVAPTSGLLGQFSLDFAGAGPLEVADAVLGVTRLPIAFQFWFVRDLFVTVLVSPALWLLLRHAPLVGAVALGAAWLSDSTLGIFIRTDVAFFFYLGGLARLRGIEPRIGWRAAKWLLLGYAVLMALRALAPLAVDMEAPEQRFLLDLATRLSRPLGVLACWGACLRLAATPLGAIAARYGGFAFFLHATHFPLIEFVKFALWRLVPAETDGWMVMHYVASVATTVALSATAAIAVSRVSPSLYRFLAGGRRLV